MKKCISNDGMKLKWLLSVSVVKTIYFNIKYFPFSVAIRFPFIIYKNTDLTLTKGKILLVCPPHPKVVEIGVPGSYSLDTKNSRTVWKCEGEVLISGKVKIGKGSVIRVFRDGILSFGKNFVISGRSSIICKKEVSFGENNLLSWDILIMDTDMHTIMNSEGKVINSASPIHIGNRVWMGCRSMVLKGVILSDDTVVAAGSIVTKKIESRNVIVYSGGILKTGITWVD